MINKIESRQNQRIKDLMNSKRLKENKLFKIEGFHAFEMAKESGVLVSVFVTKEIKDFDGEQFVVSPSIMESISSAKSPQGIISVCKCFEEKPIKSSKVLLLDNVSDPGNLGTLLRTGLAFGYNDVILNGGCSPYNEKVLQSTQGAIFNLNIVNHFDKSFVKDFNVIATEINGCVDLSKVKTIR